MVTLDVTLHLPAFVSFNIVEGGAILLNTMTNKYYTLDEVGTRLWELLSTGKSFRESFKTLLNEYEVEPDQLEQDLLELLGHLRKNGLVEIIPA